MTDTDTEQELIGDCVESEVARLVIAAGHHPDLVLGAALARLMSLIAMRHGGDMAADAARTVAQQCRGLPAYRDNPLVAMQPMGRA